MFTHIFHRLHSFFKHPRFFPLLIFNSVSCVCIHAVGDCLEQNLIERCAIPYDYSRTVKFAATGIFSGSSDHCWYYLLDRSFPGVKSRSVIIKVTLDQFFYTAFEIICFFIIYNLIDGKGFEGGVAELKGKFLEVLTVSYIFWPILQFINFKFVPLSLRVIYSEVMSLIWCMYLSWAKHRDTRNATVTNSKKRET